jgi:hypothetical protein
VTKCAGALRSNGSFWASVGSNLHDTVRVSPDRTLIGERRL